MAPKHHGYYTLKHPPGTGVAPQLASAVESASPGGTITCRKAHAIAHRLSMTPLDVGTAADLGDKRITRCQLGLFGHDTLSGPVPPLPASLTAAIEDRLDQGRLTCADAWRIADAFSMDRQEMGRACQSMGVKISVCQLGAF